VSEAEETRAAEFRAQLVRRAQWRAANARALAGDSSAAASVREAWRPLTDPQPVVLEPMPRCDPPTNAD
jgi:hypothetical protein